MNILKTVLVAAALSLAFGTAGAAAKKPTFKEADANADGSIDATEFVKATEAGVKKTFEELDKDKDGKLSKKEYSVILDADCE